MFKDASLQEILHEPLAGGPRKTHVPIPFKVKSMPDYSSALEEEEMYVHAAGWRDNGNQWTVYFFHSRWIIGSMQFIIVFAEEIFFLLRIKAFFKSWDYNKSNISWFSKYSSRLDKFKSHTIIWFIVHWFIQWIIYSLDKHLFSICYILIIMPVLGIQQWIRKTYSLTFRRSLT